MSLFAHLSNIGLNDSLGADSRKRLQLLNLICISSSIIGFTIMAFDILTNLLGITLFLFLISLSVLIPVFLNKLQYNIISRVYFLLQNYVIIFLLSVVLPAEWGYQYYLFLGAGMPLVFLHQEIGKSKWLLSFLGFPILIGIKYINTYYPIAYEFYLSDSELILLQTFNFMANMLVSILIFYLFINQSNSQIDTIKQQNERLNLLNKDLEDFSYVLTHDLKAPLQNVRSVLDLIQTNYKHEINHELCHLFKLLGDKTERMDNLIHNVLAYSKAGYQNLDIQSIELNPFIQQCIKDLDTSNKFDFKIPPLPTIQSNPTQLAQILTNLISNAIKYHDKEVGRIEIQLDDLGTNFHRFSVIDDGPGIAPKDHAKIFDFLGTANRSIRSDSTGIGLTIVKKLVSIHQGELGVISELGKGANFWFTWPKNMAPNSKS